ncbi:DUF484 family protein [Rhodobacteraceae bacterium 2CG4]|uniref:DUF484 family protein n=1 Tax=Halovulum marinum TaxID=2662447 RepID=A0A6L5Z882_9RHOB|nr:DUF484 family protein [Halovulum marinum]MSU92225.1 DUF484 family protein [Halovulum marinum]
MSEAEKPSTEVRSEILRNPDVILADRELMSALLGADGPGAGSRKIVDLRGKLVDRLEDRLDQLEQTNRTVIAAAYENLAGTNQVHRAVLALLEAPDFRAFLTTLGQEVTHILSIDAIRLGLEAANARAGTALGPKGELAELVLALPRGGVNAYLSTGADQPARRVTLRRATGVSDDLFGGEGWMQSEAVLRLDLGPGTNPALLSMGAEDPQRFTPDQATDLLTFFGGTVERMLRRWLA